MNETTKRTKSFDETNNEEDEQELSQFLDRRYAKQISSQISTNDEQIKPTVRKPTVRNLSGKRQKPTLYVLLFIFL